MKICNIGRYRLFEESLSLSYQISAERHIILGWIQQISLAVARNSINKIHVDF